MMLRNFVLVFFCLLVNTNSFSQLKIQGNIYDARTKLPLPFCNIAILGTDKGCISNADGVFSINVDTLKDIVVFSYVGYLTQQLSANQFLKNTTVYLVSNSIGLGEVEVHADNDYVYSIMEKCRKKIEGNPKQLSKIYFQLETKIGNQDVEMLECYYNGYQEKNTINQLLLKNGRIGLAATDEKGYFTSRNTSKAICYLDLTVKNDYLPSMPLQYNRSKSKKHFAIEPVFDDLNTYHFKFNPRKNVGDYFSGEIWIDKSTLSILKIVLQCEHAVIHPFLPLFAGGEVSRVNMFITQSFQLVNKTSQLNYLNFSYQLQYNNGALSGRKNNGTKSEYDVSTTGVLFFYDYNKPFQLPYFDYPQDESDYRKITGMPYNASFWENNTGMVITEKQIKSLQFFNENGLLINYKNKDNGVKGSYNAFEDNNVIWSAKSRIALKLNHLDSLLYKRAGKIKSGQYLPSELYHLQAQLFLDINPVGDSLQHYSVSVFDVTQSYYNMPDEPYTNAFMNIYFDICEIERQKMENVFDSKQWTLQQMDSIYKQTNKNMEARTSSYFKDVETGKNTKALERWNNYVYDKLGIDNLKLVDNKNH